MSVELNPCPNCGGQPKIHKTHKKFYVECDGDCWTQTGKHSYQEDAVKEWNTQIAVAKEGRQMTDHKFTDDDVIKALECSVEHNERKNASCDGCPLEKVFPYCNRECSEDTLDVMYLALINRQKAEIERLKKVLYELKMEAEMVYKQRDAQKNRADSIAKFARAEAIKEFAERLKANMSNIARMEYGGNIYFCVGYDLIDTLVKEMTEGGE